MNKSKNSTSTKPDFLRSNNRLRFRIILSMGFSNLRFKKLRTLLTVTGVVIGVGAIFFLISLGFGLRDLVTRDVTGSQSVKSVNVTAINSRIVKLDNENVTRFAEFGNVEEVGKAFTMAASASLNNAENDVVVYGVDDTYYQLSNLTIVAGERLNTDDASGAVINNGLLQAIGIDDPNNAVGKEISLVLSAAASRGALQEDEEVTITVRGVYDSGAGAELFLPVSVFNNLGVDQYSEAKVVATDTLHVPLIREQLEASGFRTQSPIDTLNEIDRVFTIFNFVLAAFGSIGMIVAVLGMFNTLTISLLERTQEVGLMMALGSRRRDVKHLFTVEAWLLAFLGGLFGIIGAMILAYILNIAINQSAATRGVTEDFTIFSFPLYLILGTLLFTTLIGLVVSYIPARRASRISPIDALRNE